MKDVRINTMRNDAERRQIERSLSRSYQVCTRLEDSFSKLREDHDLINAREALNISRKTGSRIYSTVMNNLDFSLVMLEHSRIKAIIAQIMENENYCRT